MSANPARADVMLYVQHMLGTGHLQRAADQDRRPPRHAAPAAQ